MPIDTTPDAAAFLAAAAAELGRPAAAAPSRRVAALAAVGRLCDGAVRADAAHAADLLAGAAALRDALRVAARAAELMLADAHATIAARPPGPTPSHP